MSSQEHLDFPTQTSAPGDVPSQSALLLDSEETDETSAQTLAVEDTSSEADTLASPVEESPSCSCTRCNDIEEGRQIYIDGLYHPVYIGEIYNNRYKVISKLGYGTYSTVWLVKDLESKPEDSTPYRAMKVLSRECYDTDVDISEREILHRLREGDRHASGYDNVCHLLDDFKHEGPNGLHVCLIFEPMGETLSCFRTWFPTSDWRFPTPVMKAFTTQLIHALDYAHRSGVIHTDISTSNIFVKFEDFSLIESGYLPKLETPTQDREAPYEPVPSQPLSQHYFQRTEAVDLASFKICLGDWGVASWVDKHLYEYCQPESFRAPEIMIGAKWNQKIDWWNLGCVVFQLCTGHPMFKGLGPPDRTYNPRWHLNEIVRFFGPFPKSLEEQGLPLLVDGVFHLNGTVRTGHYIMFGENLDSDVYMGGLKKENKENFISFLKFMMKIDPSERPGAAELLRHPWINSTPEAQNS